MKKVFGLLLTLVVSAGLFALDVGNGLSISGGVYVGAYFEGTDVGKKDDKNPSSESLEGSAAAKARYDDDYTGMRAQVRFTYEKDNVGATVGFRYQPVDGVDGNVYDGAYGWVKLLGGKIELSAGKLDNTKWGSTVLPVNWTDTGYDSEPGVKLDFKLVDGLSFGFATLMFGANNLPVDYWFNNTVIGTRFTKDGLIDASLAVKLDSFKNPDWYSTTNDPHPEGADWNYSTLDSRGASYEASKHSYFDLAGGAVYLGVQNLKAGLDFRFASAKGEKDAAFTGDNSLLKAGLAANYATGPISATFKAGYQNINYKDVRDASKLNINAGDLFVRLEGSYKVNDTITGGLRIDTDIYSVGGKDGGDNDIKDYKGGKMQLLFKPYVNISFGNGAGFDIYDKILINTNAYGVREGDTGDPWTTMKNIVQLNFHWEF